MSNVTTDTDKRDISAEWAKEVEQANNKSGITPALFTILGVIFFVISFFLAFIDGAIWMVVAMVSLLVVGLGEVIKLMRKLVDAADSK